ncbi:homocysteine S-methyltransferase family protein [Candidatus Roizmanbacteria bacterium]|nr:homocysteine S-methyltransferase family protein [Candidatus Roizmanbacteria bacterium]
MISEYIKINILEKRLKNKEKILMNGATGTEILNRGYKTTLPLWSAEILLTNPDVVQQIHSDYIDAGAEIIITNTFRTTERTFAKKSLTAKKARETTLLACQLVKNAIKNSNPDQIVYIAGNVAPLEDCYSPALTPSKKELDSEIYVYMENLKQGNVDFILIETQITLKEIRAAFEASKRLHIPVALTFCINDKLQLLSGESLEDAVRLAEKYNPLFIGANCISTALETKAVKKLKQLTQIPLSAHAQGDGKPEDDQGWEFTQEKSIDTYLKAVKQWIQDGTQIIGGCCGTTPKYIKSIKAMLT